MDWFAALRELPTVRWKHLQLRTSEKNDEIGSALDPFYKEPNDDTQGIEIKWFVCLFLLEVEIKR